MSQGQGEDRFAGLHDGAALASAGEDDSLGGGDQVGVGKAALGLNEHGFLLAEHGAGSVDVFLARPDLGQLQRRLGVIDIRLADLNGLAALIDFFLADRASGGELLAAFQVGPGQVERRLPLPQVCPRLGDFLGARSMQQARQVGRGVVAPGPCQR